MMSDRTARDRTSNLPERLPASAGAAARPLVAPSLRRDRSHGAALGRGGGVEHRRGAL
jgi:hypothetical protein